MKEVREKLVPADEPDPIMPHIVSISKTGRVWTEFSAPVFVPANWTNLTTQTLLVTFVKNSYEKDVEMNFEFNMTNLNSSGIEI